MEFILEEHYIIHRITLSKLFQTFCGATINWKLVDCTCVSQIPGLNASPNIRFPQNLNKRSFFNTILILIKSSKALNLHLNENFRKH